jgi:hypothetical protein
MQSERFLPPDLSMQSPLSGGLLSLLSQTSSPESPSRQPPDNRSSKNSSSEPSSKKVGVGLVYLVNVPVTTLCVD